jgi:ribonucleoside-diphosphate reductase alpha chain
MFRNPQLVNQVLRDRYFMKGEDKWEDIARRVARYVAAAGVPKGKSLSEMVNSERLYYSLIESRKFIPNSPTLFNAGINLNLGVFSIPVEQMSYQDYTRIYQSRDGCCLSACFVVPVHDSMDSIFKALYDMAMITKAGGGVGFDFSQLRPLNSRVASIPNAASGPISFMRIFDKAADIIKQGGKRRAALMGILDYTHPDALDFIASKNGNDGRSVFSFFNISIDVNPHEFLVAYNNDNDIEFHHEVTGKTGKINSRDYLRAIAESAWKCGDPGMVFTTRHNLYRSTREEANSTNPCAEQFLLPYSSCNLGSIDISKLSPYEFEGIVYAAVSFLDDVVDINSFPIQELADANLKYRNIGLGLMGIHDWLIQGGYRYDSMDGRQQVQRLCRDLTKYSYSQSNRLARKYGQAAAYNDSRFAHGVDPIAGDLVDVFDFVRQNGGLRNMALNTIAPTGTVSTIAECSSGVEPNFAFAYTRNMASRSGGITELNWTSQTLDVLDLSPDEFKHVLETGSVPRDLPEYKTAGEINPIHHVKMLSAAQKWIDASISKTVNLPNDATVDDIIDVYLLAMQSDCKGITVYRDGSLRHQVLETKKKHERAETLEGKTRVHTDDGRKTYVTVNFDKDGAPVEVFITGETNVSVLIGRMVSLALRSGVGLRDVLDQLYKTGGYAGEIGGVIQRIVNGGDNGSGEFVETSKGFMVDRNGNTKCPYCGGVNTIVLQEGCMTCKQCAGGKCSI